MAFIDITTNNLSRELLNSATFIDNWVYIPGTSITGDYAKPYLFTSLEDFKDTCGLKSPEGSITFEYVSGVLNAGLPVIFRRIACTGQDTAAEVEGITRASVILEHNDGTNDIQDVKISEKFGGTFGNDMSVSVRNTGTAVWLDVYYKFSLLEKHRLASLTTDDTNITIAEKVIKALTTTEFTRIIVEVLETDATVFQLIPVVAKPLAGGVDFDESLVGAEIPKSYEYIADKILYQPKFLTSGGYTDADMTMSAAIANSMLNLTLTRQDCRAIVDLPIGVPKEDQQSVIKAISYQQINSSQPIPSGYTAAPWCYVQVGNEQLWMPPSYVFLTTMGTRISRGGESYEPVAGLSTGTVQGVIKPEFEIGSSLAEQWQSDTEVNLNPIMKIQGGQYVISGNSTLLLPEAETGEENAFLESSADLTVIEIRRFVYNLGTQLQYQYNSVVAFETFALRTKTFLERMISEGAVTDYNIFNMSTNKEPRKLKIRIDVYLAPTIKKIEILLNVAYGNIEISAGGGN